MKIKRLALLLTLTLALLLSLCACNKGEKENGTPSTVESVSAVDSESNAEESASAVDSEGKNEESASAVDSEGKKEENSACTPLLYRVEDSDGSVLYLFGTIHLGDDRMVFPDYVMNAYNESDFLCVEADALAFEKDMNLQMEAVKKMLCETGKTIKDYLGEELYNSAVSLLEKKDMYMQAFDYYRPIMWESLLNEALSSDIGLVADNGADMQLLNMATEGGKEIREAEGFIHQYDLLMSAGDEPLVITIDEMIKYKDSYGDEINALYEAWLYGDAEKLAESTAEDYSGLSEDKAAVMKNYMDILVTQRNLAMTDLAEDYLEEGKTGFFAVGAAHIVGEGAMAQLLADRGYTVTIVEK